MRCPAPTHHARAAPMEHSSRAAAWVRFLRSPPVDAPGVPRHPRARSMPFLHPSARVGALRSLLARAVGPALLGSSLLVATACGSTGATAGGSEGTGGSTLTGTGTGQIHGSSTGTVISTGTEGWGGGGGNASGGP